MGVPPKMVWVPSRDETGCRVTSGHFCDRQTVSPSQTCIGPDITFLEKIQILAGSPGNWVNLGHFYDWVTGHYLLTRFYLWSLVPLVPESPLQHGINQDSGEH